MKKNILSLIAVYLCFVYNLIAQNGTSINTSGAKPDKSAILDVSSTQSGELMPRMTTEQRDNIASACSCTPKTGLEIFNLSTNCFEAFINGTWLTVGCPCLPSVTTINSGQNEYCQSSSGSFTCDEIPGATSYIWSYSGKGVALSAISPTNEELTFSETATSGNLYVQPANSCGSGLVSPQFAIIVNQIPTVSAGDNNSTTICPGSSYSVTNASVSNNLPVSWTSSGDGAFNDSGSLNPTYTPGTNDLSAGVVTLTLTSTNDCGSGSDTKTISISGQGTISGSSCVAPNSSHAYSISSGNGDAYTWSIPSDAHISSGNGTSGIVVNFGTSSGNIGVTYSNSCGTFSSSLPFGISEGTPVTTLDATSELDGTSPTGSFTITTTEANEIILVCLNGDSGGAVFNGGSLSVDSYTMTEINSADFYQADITIYGCVATLPGIHNISVNWGNYWNAWAGGVDMGYAASFKGFCGVPTINGNVNSTVIGGSPYGGSDTGTPISLSIIPGGNNSCLFADYWMNDYTGSGGTVTWTGDGLIRFDHISDGLSGSIANEQLSDKSSVTVTAISTNRNNGSSGNLILVDVHQ